MKRPAQRKVLIILVILLFLSLGGLGYWYFFVNEDALFKSDIPNVETGVLYLFKEDEGSESIKIGVLSYDGDEPEYYLGEISKKRLAEVDIEQIRSKELPEYISIKRRFGDYKISFLESDFDIYTEIEEDFKDIRDRLFNLDTEEYLDYSDFFYIQYASAKIFNRTEDSDLREESEGFIKGSFSEDSPLSEILEEGLESDYDNYMLTYGIAFPYICFFAKEIEKEGVVDINIDNYCDIPVIPKLDHSVRSIDESYTFIREYIREDETHMMSPTFLVDLWAKGEEELDIVNEYSLAGAEKFGLTRRDICYWILVDRLTEYKNNLYEYVVEDVEMFNMLNTLYCPGLHKPIQYKYIKDPVMIDLSFALYDL